MVCYYHPDRQAVGTCKHCQRGICSECSTLVNDTLACKDRHEDQVRASDLALRRNVALYQGSRAGYIRNGIFYSLVGALFEVFGLVQYRFLGIQALFFGLIGVSLLYAGVANFLEGRRYS
jgi:hypothetical protein